MRDTLIKLGIIAMVGGWLVAWGMVFAWTAYRNPEPRTMSFAEFIQTAESGMWVEVSGCVPDYENGCAIYESKTRKIKSTYIPLREVGKTEGRVYALLEYDTSMGAYWVAEGLALPDADSPEDAEGSQPTAKRDSARTMIFRGMTRSLSGEDSRLISSSKSGWQTNSKCIVIEENETPSPITGAGLMAGGALLSLLLFHWMFISPALARRRVARMPAKPALPPPTPLVMPAAFGEPPKTKTSPVLGQLRIFVYPLRLVLVVALLWSAFQWYGYSRGAEPLVQRYSEFKPGETDATWLQLDNARFNLTQTVSVVEPSERFGSDDKLDYYVPLTDGPDDNKPVRAFLHIAPQSGSRVVVQGFGRTREDGAAARKYAADNEKRLYYSGTVSGTTDWGFHRSPTVRGLLAMQFEGDVDPDFVIIDEGKSTSISVPLLWLLPAVFAGLALWWLERHMRSLSKFHTEWDRPAPGPQLPLAHRLPR